MIGDENRRDSTMMDDETDDPLLYRQNHGGAGYRKPVPQRPQESRTLSRMRSRGRWADPPPPPRTHAFPNRHHHDRSQSEPRRRLDPSGYPIQQHQKLPLGLAPTTTATTTTSEGPVGMTVETRGGSGSSGGEKSGNSSFSSRLSGSLDHMRLNDPVQARRQYDVMKKLLERERQAGIPSMKRSSEQSDETTTTNTTPKQTRDSTDGTLTSVTTSGGTPVHTILEDRPSEDAGSSIYYSSPNSPLVQFTDARPGVIPAITRGVHMALVENEEQEEQQLQQQQHEHHHLSPQRNTVSDSEVVSEQALRKRVERIVLEQEACRSLGRTEYQQFAMDLQASTRVPRHNELRAPPVTSSNFSSTAKSSLGDSGSDLTPHGKKLEKIKRNFRVGVAARASWGAAPLILGSSPRAPKLPPAQTEKWRQQSDLFTTPIQERTDRTMDENRDNCHDSFEEDRVERAWRMPLPRDESPPEWPTRIVTAQKERLMSQKPWDEKPAGELVSRAPETAWGDTSTRANAVADQHRSQDLWQTEPEDERLDPLSGHHEAASSSANNAARATAEAVVKYQQRSQDVWQTERKDEKVESTSGYRATPPWDEAPTVSETVVSETALQHQRNQQSSWEKDPNTKPETHAEPAQEYWVDRTAKLKHSSDTTDSSRSSRDHDQGLQRRSEKGVVAQTIAAHQLRPRQEEITKPLSVEEVWMDKRAQVEKAASIDENSRSSRNSRNSRNSRDQQAQRKTDSEAVAKAIAAHQQRTQDQWTQKQQQRTKHADNKTSTASISAHQRRIQESWLDQQATKATDHYGEYRSSTPPIAKPVPPKHSTRRAYDRSDHDSGSYLSSVVGGSIASTTPLEKVEEEDEEEDDENGKWYGRDSPALSQTASSMGRSSRKSERLSNEVDKVVQSLVGNNNASLVPVSTTRSTTFLTDEPSIGFAGGRQLALSKGYTSYFLDLFGMKGMQAGTKQDPDVLSKTTGKSSEFQAIESLSHRLQEAEDQTEKLRKEVTVLKEALEGSTSASQSWWPFNGAEEDPTVPPSPVNKTLSIGSEESTSTIGGGIGGGGAARAVPTWGSCNFLEPVTRIFRRPLGKSRMASVYGLNPFEFREDRRKRQHIRELREENSKLRKKMKRLHRNKARENHDSGSMSSSLSSYTESLLTKTTMLTKGSNTNTAYDRSMMGFTSLEPTEITYGPRYADLTESESLLSNATKTMSKSSYKSELAKSVNSSTSTVDELRVTIRSGSRSGSATSSSRSRNRNTGTTATTTTTNNNIAQSPFRPGTPGRVPPALLDEARRLVGPVEAKRTSSIDTKGSIPSFRDKIHQLKHKAESDGVLRPGK